MSGYAELVQRLRGSRHMDYTDAAAAAIERLEAELDALQIQVMFLKAQPAPTSAEWEENVRLRSQLNKEAKNDA